MCFIEQDEEDWFTPYKMAYTNTFGKPHWIDFVAKEYEACRERVGISDYSSFTKIDLWVYTLLYFPLYVIIYNFISSLKAMKWSNHYSICVRMMSMCQSVL